ncbi:uncharacterized protein LOC110834007 [Zootermopsis nevadensis]|uniref:uncharacterized protein LOC110834007 n=1 Tax=Zootermopsis nevadensis TaxID=136037 RepID=UPI000B8EC644|nr:uncharacterized protein LOC110834007 [Zootermopsis nevadensis]
MKGNTLFNKQKQVTTQIGSGPCPSQKEVRRMSKLNSMPSLKSGRGNSEMQREVKLGGTTSFKHEPPRSSKPVMNKELPKEQGSVVEQQSSIGNQCDQALNSSGEDVDSVKGSDVIDLRRINGPISTKGAVETKPDASDTFTESKHNGQEAELRTELPASQAQLGSAEHRMKEAQNKVKSLEKDIRAGQDEMLIIQASITDARNKNEQLRELLIQQQLVIEQTDSVICQECKLLKGQAKQVLKQNDMTLCIRKYIYIYGLLTNS